MDISGVREILRLPEITEVPHSPAFVEGVINPRGTVIPVISLHKRFGLDERESTNETRVMVLSVGGSLVGGIVDSVSEVMMFTDDQIEPMERLSVSISAEYITGVAKMGDRLVILLDYEKVLGANEREAVESMLETVPQ
ncbi:MAG: chemotaxis protein CheW [Chloroflexota bacterium]|nr:chemotaxis protein CheW [Chloroflexota bacterium]MDP6508561.1 chemotaxis protein CheW [Chloroflexota bacterium]MDP6758399.1 chemotaxis protein CheW [Chloroflexota bacterium]